MDGGTRRWLSTRDIDGFDGQARRFGRSGRDRRAAGRPRPGRRRPPRHHARWLHLVAPRRGTRPRPRRPGSLGATRSGRTGYVSATGLAGADRPALRDHGRGQRHPRCGPRLPGTRSGGRLDAGRFLGRAAGFSLRSRNGQQNSAATLLRELDLFESAATRRANRPARHRPGALSRRSCWRSRAAASTRIAGWARARHRRPAGGIQGDRHRHSGDRATLSRLPRSSLRRHRARAARGSTARARHGTWRWRPGPPADRRE